MNDKPKRLYVVVDEEDNPWGPFDDAKAAAKWAQEKWPHEKFGFYYDIVALREPD